MEEMSIAAEQWREVLMEFVDGKIGWMVGLFLNPKNTTTNKNAMSIGERIELMIFMPLMPKNTIIATKTNKNGNKSCKFAIWQRLRVPAIMPDITTKWQSKKRKLKTGAALPNTSWFCFWMVVARWPHFRPQKMKSANRKSTKPESSTAQICAAPKKEMISWPLAKPAPSIVPTIVQIALKDEVFGWILWGFGAELLHFL